MTFAPAWASSLPVFLDDWRRLRTVDPLHVRLSRFLDEVRHLLPLRTVLVESATIAPERLSAFLSSVGPSLQAARTIGATINPWAVAQLSNKEVRVASVLAGLWSPQQTGGTAVRFLAEFLHRIDARGSSLPSFEELQLGYRVTTEHCPDGDTSERFDVVIESERHLIGIEIKIDAPEGRAQLVGYVEAVERMALHRSKQWAVILLAKRPPSHADVLSASWADVRAAIAVVLPRRRSAFTFVDHLLATFGRHIARF